MDELEGSDWPDPGDGATRLMRRCHDLRGADIGTMTNEDLRILIGQRIGLQWLVPAALDRLGADPLAAGDLYTGDLFSSLVDLPETFWATDTPSLLRLRAVAETLVDAGERAASWLARTRGGA